MQYKLNIKRKINDNHILLNNLVNDTRNTFCEMKYKFYVYQN